MLKKGVIKPLAHVKENMENPAVMEKLFDGVIGRAEGARPPLEQDGWRAVLRDLKLLQSLIQCVTMETLSYTFNIDLAGTMIEGVVESGDTRHSPPSTDSMDTILHIQQWGGGS